jgi:hypothetical protein
MAMGLAHTNRFRGSAAFFALLLAASGTRPDAAVPDSTTDVKLPDAKADIAAATAGQPARLLSTPPSVGQAIGPASKFSRRRPPIARPGLLPTDRQAASRQSLPA